MTAAVDRIMVAFHGEGSGEADLSWGQKENWSAIVSQDTWIPLGGVKPLPEDTTVEDIAAELSYLMGRYQPMRTRLRFDERGRPRQVVHAEGEIALELVDADDGDPDAAEAAEAAVAATLDRYRNTPMDFTAEWPVRMALVRRGSRLTHMVVLISHLATDATGAVVLMTEVAARESAPVAGLQPLAQAEWQASQPGRRQNEAALRHWDSALRGIGPVRFPPSRGPEQPRYWEAEFESAAMFPAMHAIAARHGVETTTVLLALFGVALDEVTGIAPVVVRPIVGNRFRPGLAGVVCTLAQGGICVLDVAGLPFDEVLRRAQRSAMAAYKYAYFDHDDMVALRARVSAERGVELDTGCYFNDRRSATQAPDPDSETDVPFAIGSARETTLRWVLGQDAPSFEPLFVHVEDSADSICLTVNIDTHSISRADLETLLQTMETTAVKAALDPASAGQAG